jgi:uncharacterized protein with von Willebrand factor type A (vWA) domain
MRLLAVELPERPSRRLRSSTTGGHVDLRRSMPLAAATDGELVRLARRRPQLRRRDLVLVLDVSGSMAGSARALLQFAFSASVAAGGVEVFCFATRLTRLTAELHHRDVDAALGSAAGRVTDWEGGTRIASLAELNRVHGPAGRLRGAVVIICSDGLERDDPALVGREMARLARQAHRVIWFG